MIESLFADLKSTVATPFRRPEFAHIGPMEYRLARELDGRPLDRIELNRLAKGQTALDQVERYLPNGIGNIETDIRHSGGAAFRSRVLARVYADALKAGHTFIPGVAVPEELARTVAARAAGGGNCGEAAGLAAYELLPSFEANEAVVERAIEHPCNPAINHSWTELRSKANAQGAPIDVVLDAHSKMPAMLKADTRYDDPLVRARSETVQEFSTPAQSASCRRAFDIIAGRIEKVAAEHPQVAHWKAQVDRLASPQLATTAMPIVADDFRARVDATLRAGDGDIQARAKQLAAARHVVGDQGLSDAARERQAVVVLKNLRRNWHAATYSYVRPLSFTTGNASVPARYIKTEPNSLDIARPARSA